MALSQHVPVAAVVAFVTTSWILYLLAQGLRTYLVRRSIARSNGCLPARRLRGKDPILGTDLLMANIAAVRENQLLKVNAQHYNVAGGTTFYMRTPIRGSYNTMEPENLKSIQSLDFKNWNFPKYRKVGMCTVLGHGIFTTDGAQWSNSRTLLRPNFNRSQVGDLEIYERHAQHLIAAIPRDGSTVDLAPLFFRLTIDSATEFLFGESTDTLSNGTTGGFAEAFDESQRVMANIARFGRVATLFHDRKRFNKHREFVHSFVDHYVNMALKRREAGKVVNDKADSERYVFLEELAKQTPNAQRIRDELLNVLLAGRDTTASLLTNTWWVLSRRPDVWEKLQKEVSKLDGRLPTYEEIKNMTYLKNIFSEVLRLYPVVPLNAREAINDTILPRGGGPDGTSPLFIKKGDMVAWNLYAMHRRKDYFGDDAEEFRAERWADDETGKGLRTGWEYLPFNGGPRICLGQQFALIEAGYTTIRLCQQFSGIDTRDENDGVWTENLSLTCVNLGGAKVSLTPAA